MENCRIFMGTLVTILVLVLLVAVMPTEREGAIYEDTLRLHILANSDSKSDQTLKLEIRDRLLEKYSAALRSHASKEEAVESLSSVIDDMERDVDSWVAEAGYSYTSNIKIGNEWYERRDYGDFTLPEGYYTSLVVELGEADGQNWWCVMYPPLCLDIATESAPADDAVCSYTDAECALIEDGRYTVKFKLLELTSEFFAALGSRG